MKKNQLVAAYETIIAFLSRDAELSPAEKENFKGSAERAAKALGELMLSRPEMESQIKEILKVSFPLENTDKHHVAGMVTQGPIRVVSMCPHHLMLVEYEAFVSYIPKSGGTVLGLSKLARLVKILGKRAVLQEQLAADVVDCLHHTTYEGRHKLPSIASEGAAVQLIGRHSCMSCRGIQDQAHTLSTELRGSYVKDDMELKFYQAIESIRRSKL